MKRINNIIKLLVAFGYFILISGGLSAQDDPNNLELSENIMALSNKPTAQFCQPVTGSSDLYTGKATYNIPLLELKSYHAKVPVSLNYASGGVRVSDIGGWTGISWQLSAGGEISREMNGYPDELPGKGYFVHGDKPRDFEAATKDEKIDIINKSQQDDYDMQPDVFHYSLPTGSGYFVFDNDQNIIMVPERKSWSVAKTLDPTTNKIMGFSINTGDGTSYMFGGIDAVEETKISTLRGAAYWDFTSNYPELKFNLNGVSEQSKLDDYYTSKWYLKMITTQVSDVITFEYDDAGEVSYVNAPEVLAYETMTAIKDHNPPVYPLQGPHTSNFKTHLLVYKIWEPEYLESGDFCGYDPTRPWEVMEPTADCVPHSSTEPCMDERSSAQIPYPIRYFFHQNKVEVKTKIIKRINAWNQNYIEFSNDSESTLPGGCRINKISLHYKDGQEIKSYSLNYNKVISNSADPSGIHPDPFSPFEFAAFIALQIPKTGENLVPANRAQDYFATNNPPNKSLMEKYVYEGLKSYNYERFFLSQIKEEVGIKSLPPYTFSYRAPENIIRRTSVWTGISNYSTYEKLNNIYYRIQDSELYQFDNGLSFETRKTNSYGQLETITLPSGGYVKYEYQNTGGGPSRVFKIIKNDGTNSYCKRIGYNGVNFTSFESYKLDFPYYNIQQRTEYKFRMWTSYEREPLSFTKGSIVGYDIVSVRNCENINCTDDACTCSNGYEEYEFTHASEISGRSTSRLYGRTFEYPTFSGITAQCRPFDEDRNGDNQWEKYELLPKLDDDFSPFSYPYFSSLDNLRGLVKRHTIYNSDSHKIKETLNNYSLKEYSNVVGLRGKTYTFGKYATIEESCILFGLECWHHFDPHYMKKYIADLSIHYSTSVNLSSTVSTFYNDEYPNDVTKAISSITKNSYNLRNQIEETYTKEAIYDAVDDKFVERSGSDIIKKEYRYSDEFVGDSDINDMVSEGIFVPIEVISYKNGKVIGSSIKRYSSISGELFNSSAFLPSSSYNLETNVPINDANYVRGTSFTNLDNRCKEKVRYEYDPYFNIKQTKNMLDGMYTSYIWAYNHTYPIAKVENATYDEATNVLTAANFDLDAIESLCMDANDENYLNNDVFPVLRESDLMKDAFISSYTYDPLIGMTSETDPSGKTTYYTYDDFGRLETVRDKDNNILKKHEYHYVMSFNIVGAAVSYEMNDNVNITTEIIGGSGDFTYSWTLRLMGADVSTSTSEAFNHTFSTYGNHELVCTVTDNKTGATVTESINFEVIPVVQTPTIGGIESIPASWGSYTAYYVISDGGLADSFEYEVYPTNATWLTVSDDELPDRISVFYSSLEAGNVFRLKVRGVFGEVKSEWAEIETTITN